MVKIIRMHPTGLADFRAYKEPRRAPSVRFYPLVCGSKTPPRTYDNIADQIFDLDPHSPTAPDRITDTLLDQIAAKKAELDRLRPLAPHGLRNFEHSHDLELTYTSNAIEGNTLTAVETTQVTWHGITIGGKALKDHLEAIDHHDATRHARELANRSGAPLMEFDIRTLQSLVVRRSRPDTAGKYADQGRFVLTETGRHYFPSPAEIPARKTPVIISYDHVAVRCRRRAASAASRCWARSVPDRCGP